MHFPVEVRLIVPVVSHYASSLYHLVLKNELIRLLKSYGLESSFCNMPSGK